MRFVDPTVVVNQFHLRPGDTVADFGAGLGFFIDPLAAAVGSSGVVYAFEIQKNLVETMGEAVQKKGQSNVRVRWVDLEETNGTTLEPETLDVGIMINTFFQIDDTATCLAEVSRTLRSGGKFFVIDWSESFNNLGPEPAAVVTAAAARAAVETAGFIFEREFSAGAHHYGLAFRKP